jgi:hypothetical protein
MREVQAAHRVRYEQLRGEQDGRGYPSSESGVVQYRPHVLRAGLDNLLIELGVLVDLLIEEGILTRAAVEARFVQAYERELEGLQREIRSYAKKVGD